MLFLFPSITYGDLQSAIHHNVRLAQAVNAHFGIYLYGLATNHKPLSEMGEALLLMEAHSSKYYWCVLDGVYLLCWAMCEFFPAEFGVVLGELAVLLVTIRD